MQKSVRYTIAQIFQTKLSDTIQWRYTMKVRVHGLISMEAAITSDLQLVDYFLTFQYCWRCP
jgi:hypothetical protein